MADPLLSEKICREIDHWTSKYPPERKQSAVLPALLAAQEENGGWLSTDILDAVAQGIDMFDCVLPTRLGRNGTLYTTRGRINIKGSRYTDDFGPVDPNCNCRVCQRYSAAYIRHLYKCDEILASRLATYHNLAHYALLMQGIREAIAADRYEDFRRDRLAGYEELAEAS